MAEITKELGRIPVSRGNYQSTTEYYKDNIVQYKRGSYQVVSESPIVGVPPTNDKNIVNPGWTLFAGTLDAQDVVNQIKEQEAKSIQAVADREAEILAKSDAAEVSFNNTGTSFSGTNVQDALKETDNKLSELESEVIYDVTTNNDGTTFSSLSALLSSENLSTLIPTSVRHGGISIRFVQSSDNKYVQYRYMPDDASAIATFTNVANWQGVDGKPVIGSNSLVESGGVYTEINKLRQDVDGMLGSAITEISVIATLDSAWGESTFNEIIPSGVVLLSCTINSLPIQGTIYIYNADNTQSDEISSFPFTTTFDIAKIVSAEAGKYVITYQRPAFEGRLSQVEGRLSQVEDACEKNKEDIVGLKETDKTLIGSEFDLEWVNNKYINAQGKVYDSGSTLYYATTAYSAVQGGAKLNLKLSASDDYIIYFYDKDKQPIANSGVVNTTTSGVQITAPQEAYYARFCNRDDMIIQNSAKVEYVSIIEDQFLHPLQEEISSINAKFAKDVPYYIVNDENVGTPRLFNPTKAFIDYKYKGEVNTGKRYFAIGFDDTRASDFSFIMPLLNKYDSRATFNHIRTQLQPSSIERQRLIQLNNSSHEIGDHTILHQVFPFLDACFNGQNPNELDGSQVPYPSNDELRMDTGNGENVFGYSLDSLASSALTYGPNINSSFRNLTDEQCQIIRNWYSLYRDQTGLLSILDTASNLYLGTSGSSFGSWDNEQGCYMGGIFSGCKTSANHEIWERYLTLMQIYYKQIGINAPLLTWSRPGAKRSNLFYYAWIDNANRRFYDVNHTIPANCLAKFTSSLYKDERGNAKSRSWYDVLIEYGYKGSHDQFEPSKFDGLTKPAMAYQLIFNAYLSRKDSVVFPTNGAFGYDYFPNSYPESYFQNNGKTQAEQMYDDNSANKPFFKEIEQIRHMTANGIIAGDVIDSVDTYSERVCIENLLRYCKSAGIEVITKAEAYDICFNHRIENGNLIYNPLLRNTAKEFMPMADNVPTNPDGYIGDCYVTYDINNNPVLNTTGEVVYKHMGCPLGNITFSIEAEGIGSISIYAIQNKNRFDLSDSSLITTEIVDSVSNFSEVVIPIFIKNYNEAAFESRTNGLGEKIMGIKIVYSSGLQLKNIKLLKE